MSVENVAKALEKACSIDPTLAKTLAAGVVEAVNGCVKKGNLPLKVTVTGPRPDLQWLAATLKGLREARRPSLTAKEAAACGEWDEGKIGRFERGESCPSKPDLIFLVGLYGVSDKALIARMHEARQRGRVRRRG